MSGKRGRLSSVLSSSPNRKTKKKVDSSPYMSADEGSPLSRSAMDNEAAQVYGVNDPFDPKKNYGDIGHPDAPITKSEFAKYAEKRGYTVSEMVNPLSPREFIATIRNIKFPENAGQKENIIEDAILAAYPHKKMKLNKASLDTIYRALTDTEYKKTLMQALNSKSESVKLNPTKLAKDLFLGFFPYSTLSVRSIVSAKTDGLPKKWKKVIRGNLNTLFEKFLLVVEILGRFDESNYLTATFNDPVSKTNINFDQTYNICRRCLIQLLKDPTENGAIKELLYIHNEPTLSILTSPLPGGYPPILTETSHRGLSKYVITSLSLSDDIEFSPTLLAAAKKYSVGENPCTSDTTDFVYLFTVMSSVHATSVLYHRGYFYYFGGGYYDDVNPYPKTYSIYLSDFLFSPETHDYYISEVSIISYEKLQKLASFIKQADTILFEKKIGDSTIKTFLIFPESALIYKTGCTVDISGKFDSKFHSCVSTSNMVSNRALDTGGVYKLINADLYSEEQIFALHFVFSELQKTSKVDRDVISFLEMCGNCEDGFYFDPAKIDEWVLTSEDVQTKVEKFSEIPRLPKKAWGGKKKRTQKKSVKNVSTKK